MSDDMSPQAALHAAVTTRDTATAQQMPAWFPPVAAVSFMVAMVLTGWSWVIGGGEGAGRIIGLTGAALIVFHLALMPTLVLRWRRAGVVPRVGGGAPPERRRRSLWITIGSLAFCVALGAVTGNFGWAAIAFGVLGGFEAWYRLSGMRLQ
jgi:hypothetical protein